MKTQAEKKDDDQNKAAANSESTRQSSGSSTSRFIDNRPEAVAQRKLQEIIIDSPRVTQLKAYDAMSEECASKTVQRQGNKTGLPDNLKSGIENLSGYSLDDVKVHYNSDRPAQLHAHAYAQGTDIHIASGQEKHLPHEAWHVVQQKQGRVKPTLQMKSNVNINDDAGLENEADVMGAKALQFSDNDTIIQNFMDTSLNNQSEPVQRVLIAGVDIIETTPIAEIIKALSWSKLFGIGTKPSIEKIKELLAVLKEREDCKGIIDDLEDLESEESSEDDSSSSKDEGSSSSDGEGFSDGEDDWAFEFDKDAIDKKRKKAAEDFKWKGFPENYKGLKKIGVHETSSENAMSLVATGPSAEKMDSGHHLGKGPGFYITPVGGKELFTVIKDIPYGEHFVAIYVPASLEGIKSGNEANNNTLILDKDYGAKDCYYIMSGGGEIIVPVRCFHLVKVVSVLSQLEELEEG